MNEADASRNRASRHHATFDPEPRNGLSWADFNLRELDYGHEELVHTR